MTTVQQVLDLARAYVVESDRRYYSRAQHALFKLTDAVRQLPSWAVSPPVEPAAEIERTIGETMRYRIAHEDGHLVLVATDESDSVPLVLTQEQATQLLADARRVLAALDGTNTSQKKDSRP